MCRLLDPWIRLRLLICGSDEVYLWWYKSAAVLVLWELIRLWLASWFARGTWANSTRVHVMWVSDLFLVALLRVISDNEWEDYWASFEVVMRLWSTVESSSSCFVRYCLNCLHQYVSIDNELRPFVKRLQQAAKGSCLCNQPLASSDWIKLMARKSSQVHDQAIRCRSTSSCTHKAAGLKMNRSGVAGARSKPAPRIVYTFSPKVYKIQPEEFLTLVQRLTGQSPKKEITTIDFGIETSSSSFDSKEISAGNKSSFYDPPTQEYEYEVDSTYSVAKSCTSEIVSPIETRLLAALPSPRRVTLNFLHLLWTQICALDMC